MIGFCASCAVTDIHISTNDSITSSTANLFGCEGLSPFYGAIQFLELKTRSIATGDGRWQGATPQGTTLRVIHRLRFRLA